MYKIPEAIKNLQSLKTNTLIENEDTNLFIIWTNDSAKDFAKRHAQIFEKKLNTREIAILGAFISGDVVGVLPDGRIMVFIHDDTAEILISEMLCGEFSDKLLACDYNLEHTTYAKVIPVSDDAD